MYVKRLEIENIRSFTYLDIELSEGINIITGANNAGKSTIIKSLYLLQDSLALREHDLRIKTEGSGIRILLAEITGNYEKSFHDYTKGTPLFPTSNYADVYFPRNEKDLSNSFYVNIDTPYNFALKDTTQVQRRQRYTSKFGCFPGHENKGNFIYPFLAKRRNGHLQSASKDDPFQILEDLRNLPSKVQKALIQGAIKKEFNYYCNEILGFEVGVDQGINGENRIGLHLGFGDRIPLESMGEGTANILGLITLLLTENNKLFLIEEIENDIHPLALKKLLDLIIKKSTNNQFVISTHSNIILKHLGSEARTKIFYTEVDFNNESTKDSLPVSNIAEISSLEQRLEVLEKLGYDLFDFDLYSGYIIFEESSAEKIIRDFIIPQFIPELSNKIKTVASKGVNDVSTKFHSLNSLFLYLHRSEIYKNKAWVIVDGDENAKKVIETLKSNYQSWRGSHFLHFEEPYFEKYYPNRFQKEVSKIMALNNGPKKREAKIGLLNDVLSWIEKDPDLSKKEFEMSAQEVINKLQTISKTLMSN